MIWVFAGRVCHVNVFAIVCVIWQGLYVHFDMLFSQLFKKRHIDETWLLFYQSIVHGQRINKGWF